MLRARKIMENTYINILMKECIFEPLILRPTEPKNPRIDTFSLQLFAPPFFSKKNGAIVVCLCCYVLFVACVFVCVCVCFSYSVLFLFKHSHVNLLSRHLKIICGIWKLCSEECMLCRVMHHTVEEDIARDLQ